MIVLLDSLFSSILRVKITSKIVNFFDLWLFDWQVRCNRERLNYYGVEKVLKDFLLDNKFDFSVSKYYFQGE